MSDTKGSIEVIEISSASSDDEEEYDSEDYDDEEDEDDDEGAGDDASPSPQAKRGGEESPGSAVVVKTVEEKRVDDDDCCILDHDPFDSVADDMQKKLALSNGDQEDEDLAVVAEKGKVACRDYPHSRHMCADFPFDKTPHEDYCAQCFCYACDVPAPCSYWKGYVISHCHASDQQVAWRNLRSAHRKKPKPEPE